MNEYNCIIVDDERKAIEVLSNTILELYTNIQILVTCTSWKTALTEIKTREPDIVFLDISMPEKSGFDLLSFLPDLKSEVIFVTAHAQFTLDAFNYGAAGYLLKPVDDIILNKAINNAIKRIDKHVQPKTASRYKVAIPNHRGLDYVEQDDILYFEAQAKNTLIKKKDHAFISTQSFGTIKNMFNNYPFYQVHRSYIVNINCIIRYESIGILVMNDGTNIPVAKNLREDFLERFGKQI